MPKIKALGDLRITKEEGLTRDNIDKVIDVLLDTPREVFGNDKSSLTKLELIDLYYKVRTIFTTQLNTTRVWFQINCFMESESEIVNNEWELVRE